METQPTQWEPVSDGAALKKKAADVPVRGGLLRVYQFGEGPKPVLGLHGLSDNHLAMEGLARELDASYMLLVPDLRGRGASSALPAPFGLDQHAADCLSILDHFAISSSVVVGHSMGALIALHLATQRPDRFRGVVLVDGGILPRAELPALGPWLQAFTFRRMIKWHLVNPQKIVASLVGPILDNLRRTFATQEAYFEAWRSHPAYGRLWDEKLRSRFAYDLIGEAPAFRSRICAEALQEDFMEALSDIRRFVAELRGIHCPVRLIRATRGLLDQPEPMIADKVVASWTSVLPLLKDKVVEDTSHTSIMLLDRSLQEIAAFIRELSDSQK